MPSRRAAERGVRVRLHAKTFAVDDARIFIGSFNFDPRSARLNTEMGFVIESPRNRTAAERGARPANDRVHAANRR